ncbi:hypothetical protein Tco_0438246 [Tanacetum coccineum]
MHNYEQRLKTVFGRSVNRVHILDLAGLTEGMRQTLAGRLRMVYTRGDGQELFTSHTDTEMGLDVADTLCFQLGGARRRMTWRQFILSIGLHTAKEMAGFKAYWLGSERVIPDKGDLRDYWIDISSDRDFLGPASSYDRNLRRHAEGRKSGARLSGGHFIGRLAAYFGLVSDQGLRGLSVITRELPMIELHELVRLNICERLGNMWAWVAPRPERQQVAVASTPEAARDAPVVDE